ncbi:proton-conducting transporter membrane subunit [Rhodospirillales bacterium]|nr:proton-conducting transporter membrane subunit [Rhodospirillales bacterium]
MTAETLVLLALGVPFLGGLSVLFSGPGSANVRDGLTVITSIILFCIVWQLIQIVDAGGRPTVTLLQMIPGLSLTLSLEPLGMIFAGVASFLWIVTSFYAFGYMRGHHEANQTRFFFCFAIAIMSALGIAFSGNMLTLFVFYEVLTISTFPLVTHSGTDEARRAGRVYLGILLGTSVTFLLTAMIWTYVEAGTLDFQKGGILEGNAPAGVIAILFGLYIYGIGKAALMPFHRWLPAAMIAPTPVSALLHAVAVVKAGVFSVVKVSVFIFGLDTLRDTGASTWLAYVAAITILLSSIIAMRQDNLKARLAYSTISQLSYVVLGAMLASNIGAMGSTIHIVMHAFGKITLFFCAGAIIVFAHKSEISDMHGLGRKMPVTFFCFFVASLSIIGLPPLGGVWSKWYIALAAAETDQIIFIAVLMISSLLNIAYLMPVVLYGYFGKEKPTDTHSHGDDHSHHHAPPNHSMLKHLTFGRPGIAEAPIMCLAPIVLTTIGCFALFFYADRIRLFLTPVFGG